MQKKLKLILQDFWKYLEDGAKSPRNPYHLINIATINENNIPDIRTVVLRRVEPEEREIYFHTDFRSPKISAIRNNPEIAVHTYEASTKIQLRINGTAFIHYKDDLAIEHWQKTQLMSRRCYLIEPGPSNTTEEFNPGLPQELIERRPELEESEAGFENFCVVRIKLNEAEYLHLKAKGSERVKFDLSEFGIKATWLIP